MTYKGNFRDLQNETGLISEFSNVAGDKVHVQKRQTHSNEVNLKILTIVVSTIVVRDMNCVQDLYAETTNYC